MTSTLDFTIATADVLAAELDSITFAQLATGSWLSVTVTVFDGDTSTVLDTWSTTFYADERGCVGLYHLASLWRNHILFRRRRDDAAAKQPPALTGGIRVEFTYETEGGETGTCSRRIWYTRDDILTATLTLMNDKVPFVSKKKRTFLGAWERIYVIGPSARTIKVTTIYVLSPNIQTQGSSVHTLSTDIDSDSFARSIDVSPSQIQALLPSGASLREYTVQVCSGMTELDTCRYIVEQSHYMKRVQVAWLNRWGVYETLWLVGAEQQKTDRSADFGFTGDHYSALDISVVETFQQSTGYGSRAMADQVRDLAASPDVWRYDTANSRWQRITITDVDIPRPNPTNEAHACTITYRIAKQY